MRVTISDYRLFKPILQLPWWIFPFWSMFHNFIEPVISEKININISLQFISFFISFKFTNIYLLIEHKLCTIRIQKGNTHVFSVSHPYVGTGRAHWSNARFLSNSGILDLKMIAFLPNFLHANLMRVFISGVEFLSCLLDSPSMSILLPCSVSCCIFLFLVSTSLLYIILIFARLIF